MFILPMQSLYQKNLVVFVTTLTHWLLRLLKAIVGQGNLQNTTCQLGYSMKTYFIETLSIIYCTTILQSSLECTG